MNSFMTTFRQAILQSDNKNEVYKEIGINKEISLSKQLKILYIHNNFEKFNIILKNRAEFEVFANRTHTFGNFIVLPHWMNTGRYNFSQDYWDITLKSLYDFLLPLGAWKNFIERYHLHAFVNKDANFSVAELWKGHFAGTVKPTKKEQIHQFLKNANLRIEKRGKLLTKVLCDKISRYDFEFYREIESEQIEFANELK